MLSTLCAASQGQDKTHFPELESVFFSPFALSSAADGKEKITFCWRQDASGSGFKL